MQTVIKENANGGKGRVVVKHILDEKELNGKCKMFAEVTIAPVTVGDKTFTPNGQGHGIENTGDTDLVFMALIIFD